MCLEIDLYLNKSNEKEMYILYDEIEIKPRVSFISGGIPSPVTAVTMNRTNRT